jgi:hypothetical protein
VTSLYGKLKPLNTNNGSAWKFEAYLGAADDRPATLRAIVKSVIGDDAGKAVPDFANTDIPAAPAGTSPMTLIVNKTEVKYPQIGEVRIVFTVNIVLSPAEFTFAQIASTKDGTITVKRVLRISISKIPFLSNLPVVKELPQPFQKLVYLWVVKRDGDESALMEDEVKAINKELGDQSNQIDFKSSTKPASTAKGVQTEDPNEHAKTNQSLPVGHYFIVVEDNEVILDHVFNNAESTAPATPGGVQGGPPPHAIVRFRAPKWFVAT